MRVYEYVDHCLIALGITKVFGVPGHSIMPLWQNISPEIVLCAHEQEASYAAVGYAKMSRKPAVVLTSGGPGVLNSVSGIAAANIDSVPLIVISGRNELAKDGCGVLQEESQFDRRFESRSLLSGITKYTALVTGKHDAEETITRAFSEAVAPRMGCVHLSIPVDVQNIEICARPSMIKENALQKQTGSIPAIGKRPLLAMGWGCWMSGSVSLVYELAHALGAPVLVTSKAYCCIDLSSPFYLGKLGYAYNERLTQFIRQYGPDQIIAFGSSLGSKDYPRELLDVLHDASVVCVGQDLSDVSRRVPNATLVETCDLSKTIRQFLDSALRRGGCACGVSDIENARRAAEAYWEERILSGDVMAQVCHALNRIENTVVTADAGNHLLDVAALYNPSRVGGLFLDVGIRSMGTGICFCAGMAEANPDLRYVAVTGDGCMLMNGNVMHLVASRRLPVAFLVFDNSSLGRVRVGQSVTGVYRSTDIEGVDFLEYGRSFGLIGYSYNDVDAFLGEFPDIVHAGHPAIAVLKVPKDEVPVVLKGSVY